MRSMLLGVVALVLSAVAPSMLAGCSKMYLDKVVSISDRELTVVKASGEHATTYGLAPDAQVAVRGEPAELEDIRPGDLVNVITEKRGDREVAVRIEAAHVQREDTGKRSDRSDESASPPQRSAPDGLAADEAETTASDEDEEETADILFHGVITFVSKDMLRVRAAPQQLQLANEMAFNLTDETEIVVAGNPAEWKDLVEGMSVTVTAVGNGDEVTAKRVAAEVDAVPA